MLGVNCGDFFLMFLKGKIAAKRRNFFEAFLGVKNGPMVLVGGPMVFRGKLGGPMVLWTHGFETWNPTLLRILCYTAPIEFR